jgi:aspartate aminotransferase-like enzyme
MRDLTIETCSSFARLMVEPQYASPSVSTFEPATGKAASEIIASMRENGFVIGSGYGEWKDRTFRIGHMGDMTVSDLRAMLDALARVAA